MERVTFFQDRKGDGFICKTEGGKISFVDKSYKGILPKKGEEWAVNITKKLEKVNIIRPLFQIKESTSVEELLQLDGFVLRLDFFSGELVLYREGKEFKRFPYDGRWDNRMFFLQYSFPEAIRLHNLSKPIVESGKMAIVVDEKGKLVELSPEGKGESFHEYDKYCHIHEIRGDEINFVFVDEEAERKWNQLIEKTKQNFFSQTDSLPVDSWYNNKIARAIGIPDRRRVEIPVPQKMIRSSQWNDSYHEVIATAETSYNGRANEKSVCQVCGHKGKSLESAFTVYYEKSGGGYDRGVGSATHKGLGACPNCNATQDKLWGEENGEITDLPNFPDRDGDSRANWQEGEKEVFNFPFEDNDLKGELIITVAPQIGATYLQKYKIWRITSRVIKVQQVKTKCMRPDFVVFSTDRADGNLVEEVEFVNADFPPDFTAAEKYICGWLSQKYYSKEKEGVYSPEEIYDKIRDFLADMGEYFAEDIPRSAEGTKEILCSMMAENLIDFLPPDKEIESLYQSFLKDWISEGKKKEDFPSESEWKNL